MRTSKKVASCVFAVKDEPIKNMADKSIGEIIEYLKTKGFMVDLELCKDEDHCELEVKESKVT